MAVGRKSYNVSFTETKNFNVSENLRMTVLTGLTPGTMYEITALAVNGAGLGETETTRGNTLNGTAKLIHISINLTSCQNFNFMSYPDPFPPFLKLYKM